MSTFLGGYHREAHWAFIFTRLPPRWCFHCEADFIIYLYAKINPRLVLTYLSFSDTKAWRFPLLSFPKQTLSATPPSIRLLSCLILLPALSSPCSCFFLSSASLCFSFLLLLLWQRLWVRKMEDHGWAKATIMAVMTKRGREDH